MYCGCVELRARPSHSISSFIRESALDNGGRYPHLALSLDANPYGVNWRRFPDSTLTTSHLLILQRSRTNSPHLALTVEAGNTSRDLDYRPIGLEAWVKCAKVLSGRKMRNFAICLGRPRDVTSLRQNCTDMTIGGFLGPPERSFAKMIEDLSGRGPGNGRTIGEKHCPNVTADFAFFAQISSESDPRW